MFDEMTTEGLDLHINLFSNWQISLLVPEDRANRQVPCEGAPPYRFMGTETTCSRNSLLIKIFSI